MIQVAFNTASDGTARTIKANYWKDSLANFIRRDDGFGVTAVACIDDRVCVQESAERDGI